MYYVTTERRVGHDLLLLAENRQPLSRDKLGELIGIDRITSSPETHRELVRASVFGLTGQLGKERFDGLTQLVHTLRSPDVGDRIDEGKLPTILSDALPPLSETALKDAGERLDGLSETRAQLGRMEAALQQVRAFVAVHRRYTSTTLAATADEVSVAVRAARAAHTSAKDADAELTALGEQHERKGAERDQLIELVGELQATISGIKSSAAYAAGQDLDNLSRRIDALAGTARVALKAAATARTVEAEHVNAADTAAAAIQTAADSVERALLEARRALDAAGVGHGASPEHVAAVRQPAVAGRDSVWERLEDDPALLTRPEPDQVAVTPADLTSVQQAVHAVTESARNRAGQAGSRLKTAGELDAQRRALGRAEEQADRDEQRADKDGHDAEQEAAARDSAARHLATQWRGWVADPETTATLGEVDWPGTPAGELLRDADVLVGNQRVHVCENPQVLQAAARARLDAPLLCLSGNPAIRQPSGSRSSTRSSRRTRTCATTATSTEPALRSRSGS